MGDRDARPDDTDHGTGGTAGFCLRMDETTTLHLGLAGAGFNRVLHELSDCLSTLVWGVQAIGFWLAVAAPFLYLPLVYRGFANQTDVLAFVGLVVLNVGALVAGHGYRR